jgi:hypothetical protein
MSIRRPPAVDPFPLRTSPTELVSEFLDQQWSTGAFAYAIVMDIPFGPIACLTSTPTGEWPRIVIDAREARRGVRALAERGARGFELVLASSSCLEDLRAFFTDRGYRNDADALYGSGDNGDISATPPHDDRFARALSVAMMIGGATLCVFAHDVDPVYLLSSIRRE